MPTSPHPDKNPKTNSLNKKNASAETTSNHPTTTTTTPSSTSSPAQSVARPLDSPTSLPLDRFTAHASHLHQRPVSSRSNSNVVITSTLPTEDHHHHHHGANTGQQGLRPTGSHPHAPSSSSSSSSSLSVRSFQAQARNVVASLTGFGSSSPVDTSGVEDGNGNGAQIHQQNAGPQSEMMAIAEARLFTQQLMQQQMQNQDLRRTSLTGSSSGRSLFGSVLGRGAATSTIGGGGGGTGTGGTGTGAGSGGHSSPVIGGDEPSEQTLLLARPLWVQDQDAAACRICARTFNAVRRKVLYQKGSDTSGRCIGVCCLFIPTTILMRLVVTHPPSVPFFLCTRWMGILGPAFSFQFQYFRPIQKSDLMEAQLFAVDRMEFLFFSLLRAMVFYGLRIMTYGTWKSSTLLPDRVV